MDKNLRFGIEDAGKFFNSVDRTENEEYLLSLVLRLGKEYNRLIDKYNRLVLENEHLNRKLKLTNKYPYTASTFNKRV